MSKIRRFLSVIYEGIVSAQQARANSQLRFHSKGLFHEKK